MAKCFSTVFLMLIMFWIYHEIGASNTNFEIKRFELCNSTQGQIKFYGNVTKENGNQYFTYNVITPVPWGDNLSCSCLIQTRTIGNIFVELFTIREKNICKAFNKYLGEFWYDIVRASQLLPRACPIREGKYHAHHVLLDFTKISLQTFPFGRLRFITKAVDNKNINANMLCILMEVENIPN